MKEIKFENLNGEEIGGYKIRKLPIKITVQEKSSLHIGSAEDPLTGMKAAIYKIDGIPVIPASSFKGALRSQMELYFINNLQLLKSKFNVKEKEILKPCIPSVRRSIAEKGLVENGIYRETSCQISITEKDIEIPKIKRNNTTIELGICPVCYFLGAAGLTGFIRINDFYPIEREVSKIVEKTQIRIDRGTKTAASGHIVTGEIVKPGTKFEGEIEIIERKPEGFEFGKERRISGKTLDKWLENCNMEIEERRNELLKILVSCIENIRILGGWKSRGSGKVKTEINNKIQSKI
ncbi:MAG: hypothetical protein DRJ30_06545 [Candidatus Methanomethylicota archaeon]|nr:MAG: hypothetical protein DRJ30_06545 [Candidatus Verstraetearchaeota archaeon]